MYERKKFMERNEYMKHFKKNKHEQKTKSDCGCDNKHEDKSKCYYSGNCNCGNPNCKGECRCNCKCEEEDHSDNMCEGVFAPICEPEVCDIPRIPRKQNLVVGNGTICKDQIKVEDENFIYESNTKMNMDEKECKDEECKDKECKEKECEDKECKDEECKDKCCDEKCCDTKCCGKKYRFTIHIYREFTSHFGKFTLYDNLGAPLMTSEKLECYHAPDELNMVALFHVTLDDNTSREVSIYAKQKSCHSPAAFYVYSAPLFHEEINVGSDLLQGELKIFKDQMSHEH